MIENAVSRHTLGIAIVFGLGWLTLENAGAGGFRTLPEEVFETFAGFEYSQSSGPSNFGDAMETETYEFRTKALEDSRFRCRIRANTTGQNVVIRLLGVDGKPYR